MRLRIFIALKTPVIECSLVMNILENVTYWLDYYRLRDSLDLSHEYIRQEPDRIFCWPKTDRLAVKILKEQWPRDPKRVSNAFHGSGYAYREPTIIGPSLQVVFHWHPVENLLDYFLELDFDLSFVSLNPIGHLREVLQNTIFRSKTDQEVVARMLKHRFEGEG